MTDWDKLTELERLVCIYSDAHKDAYGFRPRHYGVHNPVTVQDYRLAIEECLNKASEDLQVQRKVEADRLTQFNSEIAVMMHDHSIDRHSAIRWWFESNGYEKFDFGDGAGPVHSRQEAEYILYNWGLGIPDWDRIIDEFLA